MDPVEALADCIMQFEGWSLSSRSWRNRNPGNLRPYNPSQQKDEGGYRVFQSLDEGWDALKLDLESKFGGSHNLTPQSHMIDLFNIYAPAGDANNPSAYTTFVCERVTKILGRTITPITTLEVFLGKVPNNVT